MAAASVSIPKGKPQLPPASLCSSLSSVSVCYPGCLKVTASALGLGSCAVLYVPFRSRVFVSYSPWLSCVQAPLALKLHVLEAHLPCAGVPKLGLGPLTSWRDVYYWLYSCLWVALLGRGSWSDHALLPFLLWIFLYSFSCGFSLMVALWIVVVLVSVAGGEPGSSYSAIWLPVKIIFLMGYVCWWENISVFPHLKVFTLLLVLHWV